VTVRSATAELLLAGRGDALQRLPALHDRLRRAATVGELLAHGAQLAREECAFGRAVVVGVRDGRLDPAASDPIAHEESDVLRRRLLAVVPELGPDSLEGALLRHPTRPVPYERPSVLAERLGLDEPAFGCLAPEGRLAGILVLDRPGEPVTSADRVVVRLFGAMLAVVLEQVVQRARVAELFAELRYLTVSAQALATEAFDGPITLPVHGRHLPAFRNVGAQAAGPGPAARALLNEREVAVAELVAQGRSNREIAEHLFLSTETVKDHVARIARKLGAANRVDAAVRFLGLDQRPPTGGR